jgi:acylphosphatase
MIGMRIQVQVRISGRVQGVWYRASTKQKAEELKLTGWVKNNPDGCVEAVFEGEEGAVNAMVAWCRVGPPHAQVTDVKVAQRKALGGFTGFEVVHE